VPLHHARTGSGEPLVLVHGLASSAEAWARIVPALAERFDVIAIDLPGFGRSAPDGTPPSVEGQAARVARCFDEVGVTRPHVAGFSMGGGIALQLARLGAVRSATAIAPVGFWTDRERAFCQRSLSTTIALARRIRPVAPTIVSTAAGRTALFSQTFARPWRMTPGEALSTLDAAISCPGFEPCNAAFSEHRFREPGELRSVPLTIAWGDRDRLLLYRQARRARRMLPWARHVTLTGCGHAPFTDDEAQVAQVVLAGATVPASARAPV
jgi:pimeloyl-ACP methyl ester carboxylesterase